MTTMMDWHHDDMIHFKINVYMCTCDSPSPVYAVHVESLKG